MKETQGLRNQELKKKKTRCRDIWMKSRHQHCIRSRRNISLQEESCRDNIRLLRQQLYRKEVATTPGCRDISCMDQEVATRSIYCDTNFTSNLSQPHKVCDKACDKNCDKACDKKCDKNRGRNEGMMSRQHQHTGPVH